jgi:ABC-2 type transport system permease protein
MNSPVPSPTTAPAPTPAPAAATGPATAHGTVPRATFANTLHGEWIKFRSLRSTWYTVVALFVIGPGITYLAASNGRKVYEEIRASGDPWDPTALSLRSYIMAQLVIGVLSILVVTSEHATGLIRTSLTATPRRNRLLAAKVVMTTAVALVAGQALMFAVFLLGQALLADRNLPNAGLGDPDVLGAVVGGGLYLAAIAVLAVALGTIMRATAGALATLVGIVLLVPAFAGLFPSWLERLLDFWPTLGAGAVMATVPSPDYPHPWQNLGGLYVGVTALLAVAFVVFRRRDV